MAVEEASSVNSKAFSGYYLILEMVKYYKYLGRVLSVADDE